MISPADDSGQDREDDRIFVVSPDGELALTMEIDVDGECLLGFHGFEWRQQGSVLCEMYGTSVDEACQSFLQNIINDGAVIAVLSCHGDRADVWVTEDPREDLRYLKDGEKLEFRYWSGKSANPAEH